MTDKYLDLAKGLKNKLWNMKVMVISIVVGELGTVHKGLRKYRGIGNQRKNQDNLDHGTLKIS